MDREQAWIGALMSEGGLLRRVLRESALQDWLVLGYVVALNIAALTAPPSAARNSCAEEVGSLLLFLVASLVAIRGGLLRHNIAAPLLYRLAIYGSVQLSYFLLRNLLPVVNTGTLDEQLYGLDHAIFGFEPAMLLDAIVTPLTTEWFSFFYFGYFFLLAVHVIPMLFFYRERRVLGEFCFGMLFVFCIGHIVYMLVPGYGPYRAMAGEFENTLPSGMWLDLVMQTVASGGAQKDIFPSIHTAAPTFIALFSYRNRHRLPFRYTWLPVMLFAVNIIIATMFLRWHYIIDVVAGLTLGGGAVIAGAYATSAELKRRRSQQTESWPEFLTPRADTTLHKTADQDVVRHLTA